MSGVMAFLGIPFMFGIFGLFFVTSFHNLVETQEYKNAMTRKTKLLFAIGTGLVFVYMWYPWLPYWPKIMAFAVIGSLTAIAFNAIAWLFYPKWYRIPLLFITEFVLFSVIVFEFL